MIELFFLGEYDYDYEYDNDNTTTGQGVIAKSVFHKEQVA